MNGLSGLPWLKVISNFLWILGAAFVLARLSLAIFLKKRKIFISTPALSLPLKKILISGLILILAGGAFSLVMTFIRPAEKTLPVEGTLNIDPAGMMGKKEVKKNHIIMSENGHLRTKKIQFEKSAYLVRIVTRGAPVKGVTARLKIYIGLYLIADFYVPTRFEEKTFIFESRKSENRRLRVEFVNDYFDPAKNLNRNASIKSLSIKKKNTPL